MSQVKPEQADKGKDDNDLNNDSNFECNICLDTAKDAVVSMCGHLFCWPCLHQWLETKPQQQVCPVCKAAISRSKVIPLYGRGFSQQDPRDKLPPRPQGQRTEPEPTSSNIPGFNFGFGDAGFHLAFGIGAFPFGIFASTYNLGDYRSAPGPNSNEMTEENYLNQAFKWLAIILIFWLLIA